MSNVKDEAEVKTMWGIFYTRPSYPYENVGKSQYISNLTHHQWKIRRKIVKKGPDL